MADETPKKKSRTKKASGKSEEKAEETPKKTPRRTAKKSSKAADKGEKKTRQKRKPKKAEEKPKKAEEKAAKAEEKAAKAEEKAAEAEEKVVQAEEKVAQAETVDDKPAKAEEKPKEREKKAVKTEGKVKAKPDAEGAVHFLTGFPGFIGRRLVRRLAEEHPKDRLVLLVQPHLAALAQQDLNRLAKDVPGLNEQAELVRGDISEPKLGVEADRYEGLLDEITRVWHLAAIYDLAVGPRVAYRVNVIGTANVLDFCEAAHRFEQLNYVSTCYVAGERTGLVLESELDEGQGHKNHYESTKFWAELEVQRRWNRIPTTIFRPGIVVGDSKTGETDKYDGPYFLIGLLHQLPGWMPWVNVGAGEALVNLVPVDFVVEAMLAIAKKPEAIGKVFQLADHNPMRARDLTALILKTMGRRPPIATIPEGIMNAAMSVRRVRRLLGMPKEVLVYFNHDARYDVTNTLELLADTGIRCPHISEYIQGMVDYVERNPQKRFIDRRKL